MSWIEPIKETMLKIGNENLEVISEGIWILFCYRLFPYQKYRSGVGGFHFLIQEQPQYDQPTLPCKSVRLNCAYKYLRPLFP